MVSIIVSIYNVEAYLDRCIKSILKQTYKDFELILVDDGSPDNCPIICDIWGKRDARIRVFHKENGGISSARNYGIEQARGEYIIFPDPDDWVEPEYLKKMLEIREKYKADLCICGHYICEHYTFKNNGVVIMTRKEALKQLMMPRLFCGYAWNKLYSMEVIKNHKLRFDVELGMVQDLHFNVRYFQHCNKIVYDPVPLYHYVIDGGGVTSRYTTLTPRRMSGLLSYIKIAGIAKGKYPEVKDIAYASLCKMCLDDLMIYYRTGIKHNDIRNVLKNYFLKYRRYFYKSNAYTKEDKYFSKLVIIHPRMYYYARRFFWKVIVPVKRGKRK